MNERPVIIGAGCAGLSCARTLHDAGERPIVLEKARGVGGRCATRRIDDQPVDHGALFYHGSHPDFLEALDRVDGATQIEAWPSKVEGGGSPCLPRAFRPHERRLAFAEGMTAFPKSLARGLDVSLSTRVATLSLTDHHFEIETEQGAGYRTQALVLALPAEQMRVLASSLPATPELESTFALSATLATDPCLTVIAGYHLDRAVPDWDVFYPARNDTLLLVSHDSTKREQKRFHAFVFQCTANFSRRHLEDDPTIWVPEVLREAAALLGPWGEVPSCTGFQRWRFGRSNGCPLTRPISMTFPGGPRLGLAGEFFDGARGVEAAFLSGRALAERMLEVGKGVA